MWRNCVLSTVHMGKACVYIETRNRTGTEYTEQVNWQTACDDEFILPR